jgi:hypothetical protein
MRNLEITTTLAIIAIIAALGAAVVVASTTAVNNEMAYASKGDHKQGRGNASGNHVSAPDINKELIINHNNPFIVGR